MGSTGLARSKYLTDDPTLAETRAGFRALGGEWYGSNGADILYGAAGDDELYGGAGNDKLSGNAGADWLVGGTGADSMAGRLGNDIYVVDNARDSITEPGTGGIDTVGSFVSHTLSPNVEDLVLLDDGNLHINGTGNASANSILGNAGNNRLSGGAGDDLLEGGDGDDILDGGTGVDQFDGGAGDDTYILDSPLEVIEDAGGVDLIQIRFSASALQGSAIRPALSLQSAKYASAEGLVVLGSGFFIIDGNDAPNILKGNSSSGQLYGRGGDDDLDGGGGADAMHGGPGDDVYRVDSAGDTVDEIAGEGHDTVVSSMTYSIAALPGVENITLTGRAGLKATGNAGSNRLVGNDGANLLDGGSGADTLEGGKGNDTYVLDDPGDQVIETAGPGGGVDVVRSSVSLALGDHVEHAVLLDAGSISATGNALANTITGNAGNNALSGLGGNDRLAGDAGDDQLYGGEGDDTMLGGAGNDTYAVDSRRDVLRRRFQRSPGAGWTMSSARPTTRSARISRT